MIGHMRASTGSTAGLAHIAPPSPVPPHCSCHTLQSSAPLLECQTRCLARPAQVKVRLRVQEHSKEAAALGVHTCARRATVCSAASSFAFAAYCAGVMPSLITGQYKKTTQTDAHKATRKHRAHSHKRPRVRAAREGEEGQPNTAAHWAATSEAPRAHRRRLRASRRLEDHGIVNNEAPPCSTGRSSAQVRTSA